MISLDALHGRRIAMVAWAKKPDGTDDVAVFTGIAERRLTSVVVVREPPERSFLLRNEWLERVIAVPEELRDVLCGADYQFSVAVGDIDDAEDPSALEKTGLMWLWPHGEKAG